MNLWQPKCAILKALRESRIDGQGARYGGGGHGLRQNRKEEHEWNVRIMKVIETLEDGQIDNEI